MANTFLWQPGRTTGGLQNVATKACKIEHKARAYIGRYIDMQPQISSVVAALQDTYVCKTLRGAY